jgi:hypothetical protein
MCLLTQECELRQHGVQSHLWTPDYQVSRQTHLSKNLKQSSSYSFKNRNLPISASPKENEVFVDTSFKMHW